jgi:alkanesulfonate monooxygenase SsuD/methylene tetrahydromethanopterin reductase-like flavin-dependent oxidoreductase (luciferase family)
MTETTGRPRVGVLLPTVDGFRAGAWDIRSFARRAEDLGFDSLWVADHLVFDAPILESVVAAATAAAVTERITIGFGVMQVALRHPAWTAKQLAALQVVSGNGIEFGVRVGASFSAEWSAVGVRLRERGRPHRRLPGGAAVAAGRRVDRPARPLVDGRAPADPACGVAAAVDRRPGGRHAAAT